MHLKRQQEEISPTPTNMLRYNTDVAIIMGIHTAVRRQLQELTHPEVVHEGDGALEALRDLHIDVLVEAGAHRAEWRQRGPVILTGWWREEWEGTKRHKRQQRLLES